MCALVTGPPWFPRTHPYPTSLFSCSHRRSYSERHHPTRSWSFLTHTIDKFVWEVRTDYGRAMKTQIKRKVLLVQFQETLTPSKLALWTASPLGREKGTRSIAATNNMLHKRFNFLYIFLKVCQHCYAFCSGRGYKLIWKGDFDPSIGFISTQHGHSYPYRGSGTAGLYAIWPSVLTDHI